MHEKHGTNEENERKFEELKGHLDLMLEVNYKSFLGHVCATRDYSAIYMESGLTEHKALSLESLETVEDHYREIDFRKLAHVDFDPIYLTSELLEQYGSIVRGFFEDPSEGLYEVVSGLAGEIGKQGLCFARNFKETFAKIRKIPGHEGFRAQVIDRNGEDFGRYY